MSGHEFITSSPRKPTKRKVAEPLASPPSPSGTPPPLKQGRGFEAGDMPPPSGIALLSSAAAPPSGRAAGAGAGPLTDIDGDLNVDRARSGGDAGPSDLDKGILRPGPVTRSHRSRGLVDTLLSPLYTLFNRAGSGKELKVKRGSQSPSASGDSETTTVGKRGEGAPGEGKAGGGGKEGAAAAGGGPRGRRGSTGRQTGDGDTHGLGAHERLDDSLEEEGEVSDGGAGAALRSATQGVTMIKLQPGPALNPYHLHLQQTQPQAKPGALVTDMGADPATGQDAEAIRHRIEEQINEESEGEEDQFDPYLFIKTLPPLEQCVSGARPYLLPKQTRSMGNRKTLVLDLDETLVHACVDNEGSGDFTPDFSFPVSFNKQTHVINVKQRPHLQAFMERVSELFEVVIFTASQKIYAERLLNILDPARRYIRHRIFRDSCVIVDGNYLKDLSVLGRDLRHTVIVDNSPQAFGFQVDNGVPIESWYDDMADTELLQLVPFLEALAGCEDVRPLIRDKFRLHEKISSAK